MPHNLFSRQFFLYLEKEKGDDEEEQEHILAENKVLFCFHATIHTSWKTIFEGLK